MKRDPFSYAIPAIMGLAYTFLVSGLPFGIKSNAWSGIATPLTSIIRKYIVSRNRFRGGIMSHMLRYPVNR